MDSDRGSKPTMGSLFAGIGGFDLGFERAGFKTSWQVEIDPYCQKVLAKNFPEAERFGDIRECGSHNLKPVDVICGGFPCQDISNAGKRAGIEGERSGLWSEYARIIRELRPSFVVIENVAALVGFGLERVLCDLAAIGFDAEWDVISASSVGAPHIRRRLWILAYPGREGVHERGWDSDDLPQGELASRDGGYDLSRQQQVSQEILGNSDRTGRQELDAAAVAVAERFDSWATLASRNSWAVEPDVGRVAHGVPKRVDRLRGLGNAVVPQIPEMIARRIKEHLR